MSLTWYDDMHFLGAMLSTCEAACFSAECHCAASSAYATPVALLLIICCWCLRNVVSIDGYEDVPENDEAALKKAVSMQPVSVAICASGGLQFYSSGVVDGKCCTELDHGVLAVGYGVVGCLAVSSAV